MAVPVPPALVALMVTWNGFTLKPVGVPVIAPVLVFTFSPEGNPLAPKLVGLLVAVMVYENATPCLPLAVRELLMTGVAGLIVIARFWGALVPLTFAAVMLPLYVAGPGPAAVGVPENNPVVALKFTPGMGFGPAANPGIAMVKARALPSATAVRRQV